MEQLFNENSLQPTNQNIQNQSKEQQQSQQIIPQQSQQIENGTDNFNQAFQQDIEKKTNLLDQNQIASQQFERNGIEELFKITNQQNNQENVQQQIMLSQQEIGNKEQKGEEKKQEIENIVQQTNNQDSLMREQMKYSLNLIISTIDDMCNGIQKFLKQQSDRQVVASNEDMQQIKGFYDLLIQQKSKLQSENLNPQEFQETLISLQNTFYAYKLFKANQFNPNAQYQQQQPSLQCIQNQTFGDGSNDIKIIRCENDNQVQSEEIKSSIPTLISKNNTNSNNIIENKESRVTTPLEQQNQQIDLSKKNNQESIQRGSQISESYLHQNPLQIDELNNLQSQNLLQQQQNQVQKMLIPQNGEAIQEQFSQSESNNKNDPNHLSFIQLFIIRPLLMMTKFLKNPDNILKCFVMGIFLLFFSQYMQISQKYLNNFIQLVDWLCKSKDSRLIVITGVISYMALIYYFVKSLWIYFLEDLTEKSEQKLRNYLLDFNPVLHISIIYITDSQIIQNKFELALWFSIYFTYSCFKVFQTDAYNQLKKILQGIISTYDVELRQIKRVSQFVKIIMLINILFTVFGLWVFAKVEVYTLTLLFFGGGQTLVESLKIQQMIVKITSNIQFFVNNNADETQEPYFRREMVFDSIFHVMRLFHFIQLIINYFLRHNYQFIMHLWLLYLIKEIQISSSTLKGHYDQYQTYKKIMENLDSLFPKVPFEELKPDDICSICHDQLIIARKIQNCNHKFHIKCLYQWLKNSKNTCPNCKQNIPNLNINFNHQSQNILARIFRFFNNLSITGFSIHLVTVRVQDPAEQGQQPQQNQPQQQQQQQLPLIQGQPLGIQQQQQILLQQIMQQQQLQNHQVQNQNQQQQQLLPQQQQQQQQQLQQQQQQLQQQQQQLQQQQQQQQQLQQQQQQQLQQQQQQQLQQQNYQMHDQQQPQDEDDEEVLQQFMDEIQQQNQQ